MSKTLNPQFFNEKRGFVISAPAIDKQAVPSGNGFAQGGPELISAACQGSPIPLIGTTKK